MESRCKQGAKSIRGGVFYNKGPNPYQGAGDFRFNHDPARRTQQNNQERNYELFLRLYEKHLAPVTDLFAYCLLKNHFHFSLRVKAEEEIKKTLIKTLRVSDSPTIQADLSNSLSLELGKPVKPLGSDCLGPRFVSDRFSNFFNAYAKTINKTYDRTGSLFQHPFGRVPITTDRQFWNVIAYIHQNPQKHGFVKDYRDWKYSSYGILLNEKCRLLDRAEVMKWFGNQENTSNQYPGNPAKP